MAASPETQSLKGPGLAAALAAAVAAITPGAQPLAAFLTTFAVSYGLQAWSMREARKRSMEDRIDARQTIRSAIAPRRVVYGEAVVSGVMAYAQVTGTDKEYLHTVTALAGSECYGVGDVYLDDERIDSAWLDGSGIVTAGTFSGLARFAFVLGTTTQSAFADLVTESGGRWTSAHQGKGVAAVYARIKWDQDKFAGGIPNVRVQVRGRKCYDPRDTATRYTMNPALILRDYLTADFGLACTSGEIDDAAIQAAANVCDEWVALDAAVGIAVTADHTVDTFTTAQVETRIQTGDRVVLNASVAPTGLTGGGTYYVIRRGPSTFQIATTVQNALQGTAATFTSNGTSVTFNSVNQRRYAMSGTFTLDQAPKDIIDDILQTMAGSLVWTGGQWRVLAGAYVAPTVTVDADDLRGAVAFRNRVARKDLVNTIRGSYAEPARSYGVTDYPAVSDTTMVTNDGEAIERTLDQPFVTNGYRCQRLAKIGLRKARAQRLTLPCKISALGLAAADTITVNLPQLGISSQAFRVVGWRLSGEGGGIGVDLDLEEEQSSHYDWSGSEGVAPPVNAGLDLPAPVTVTAPASLTVTSGTSDLLLAGDGTVISRMKVTWSAAADPNVVGYELQWKRNAESTYNSVVMPRDGVQYYIGPVVDDDLYQLRVRTLAAPSRRSSWTTNTHTVVGKSAAPTAPTSIGVTQLPNALALAWSACPDADYAETEVWEGSVNDRASATQVATLKGTALTRSGFTAGAVRYYWVRHKDTTGNLSAWYPSSATGGVSGTAGADPGNEITHDFTGFLAGGATGFATGEGYWLGYHSGKYKFHLGNPAGDWVVYDGTNFYVAGAIIGGSLRANAAGSILVGANSYLSGAGIFLGYDGAAYKMHVGDPSGSHIKWDGATLTIKGSLVTGDIQVDTAGNVRGGQTAYNTGTGFWIGYSGGAYKFSIGNPSGNYLTWDGSTLTLQGALVDKRQFSAGTNIVASSPDDKFAPLPSGTWSLVKSIRVPRSGTIRATWNVTPGTTGANTKTKVYVSGVAVGTEFTDSSIATFTHSDDVSVTANDTVEIWAWWNLSNPIISRFTLGNSFNEYVFVNVVD